MRNKKEKFLLDGWTFVETMVVMAIVLVLTASVGFSSIKQLDKAKVVTAKTQIELFSVALETFYMDTGEYPSEDEGLSVLWECSFSSYENWNGPYISKPLPKDPWGNDYVYTVPGENGLAWKIMSLGKDGKEGGAGYDSDITSS
ncbi:MAG: type II secretion system major pseudopilin GspG [Spirochaetia bacterium]|nr:type II secretion system major pseudopilin GspG [uncultured Treponema sp.]MCI7398697.1 type II secretion system major pseudopilin GspG [Spirochaetia bacterium]MCI7578592.1 type II secretion system major pseudopilin GspG [Spirochaetia bacterium]